MKMIKGKLSYNQNKWVIKYTEEKWWQPPHNPGIFGPTYKNWTPKEINLHAEDVKYVEMFKDISGGFMYNNLDVDFNIIDLDGEQFATIYSVKIATMEWDQIYKEYKNSLLYDDRLAQEGLLSWLKQYYNPPTQKVINKPDANSQPLVPPPPSTPEI